MMQRLTTIRFTAYLLWYLPTVLTTTTTTAHTTMDTPLLLWSYRYRTLESNTAVDCTLPRDTGKNASSPSCAGMPSSTNPPCCTVSRSWNWTMRMHQSNNITRRPRNDGHGSFGTAIVIRAKIIRTNGSSRVPMRAMPRVNNYTRRQWGISPTNPPR